MPEYLQETLEGAGLLEVYEARPPYQRNDYIGWIERAKREATRERRVQQMLQELAQGDVYMKMAWNPGRVKGEG